ncbi:retrovirus-related Pol polyprotein from transposon 17.6 [Trichonephila clavipes]|nr:retrovirus-related Pol polyprotein from transposon 17.6 [Trichonephila clavipes]
MLKLGIIEVGESDYMSPMILVEVAGKEPRPCIDYRKLNGIIRTEYFPLPNIEQRVEKVSAAKFITVLDLSKGYWQIPLSKTAQRYAAFCTSFVMTDHNPLVWLNRNVSSNPRLMRWALALHPYNFRIVYRSGKSHKNADSLSRSVIDN